MMSSGMLRLTQRNFDVLVFSLYVLSDLIAFVLVVCELKSSKPELDLTATIYNFVLLIKNQHHSHL